MYLMNGYKSNKHITNITAISKLIFNTTIFSIKNTIFSHLQYSNNYLYFYSMILMVLGNTLSQCWNKYYRLTISKRTLIISIVLPINEMGHKYYLLIGWILRENVGWLYGQVLLVCGIGNVIRIFLLFEFDFRIG